MNTSQCPVCSWEISGTGIQVPLAKSKITVCCEECAKALAENPEKYTQN